MLEITYVKLIPFSFDVVLAQYFDYEHIAHVHPETLGEYVLIENTDGQIIYEQRWPPNWRGHRAVSRVEQTFEPPGEIWFKFLSGKHQGTKVRSVLVGLDEATEVKETYFLPGLPNWSILRRFLRPLVVRQVDRVWDEDLRVGVCIGGWPGIPPESESQQVDSMPLQLPPGNYDLGAVDQFPPNKAVQIDLADGSVLILNTEQEFRAMHPFCPHTGGPMTLGQFAAGCLTCPWHGAKFDARTGAVLGGPTAKPLPVYQTVVQEGRLSIIVSA